MTTTIDLSLVGVLAAVWLAAGLLADTLPDARTALALHRRTDALLALVGLGGALLVAVPIGAVLLLPERTAVPLATLLPALPALVVLTTTVRRLAWLRRGTAAFAAAPMTPASPALRAAAAHPLVATPLQVTGLAAIAGTPVAGGLVQLTGTGVVGVVITAVGLLVLLIGIRHGLRHSRLAEHAVRVRAAFRSV